MRVTKERWKHTSVDRYCLRLRHAFLRMLKGKRKSKLKGKRKSKLKGKERWKCISVDRYCLHLRQVSEACTLMKIERKEERQMVLPIHFWTTEQFADLFHALYTRPTPLATLYTHLPGTLQRVGRKCTHFIYWLNIATWREHTPLPCDCSEYSVSDSRSHTLFNNLSIFSEHSTCDLSLSQHSIIIYQGYILGQKEVCQDG